MTSLLPLSCPLLILSRKGRGLNGKKTCLAFPSRENNTLKAAISNIFFILLIVSNVRGDRLLDYINTILYTSTGGLPTLSTSLRDEHLIQSQQASVCQFVYEVLSLCNMLVPEGNYVYNFWHRNPSRVNGSNFGTGSRLKLYLQLSKETCWM